METKKKGMSIFFIGLPVLPEGPMNSAQCARPSVTFYQDWLSAFWKKLLLCPKQGKCDIFGAQINTFQLSSKSFH